MTEFDDLVTSLAVEAAIEANMYWIKRGISRDERKRGLWVAAGILMPGARKEVYLVDGFQLCEVDEILAEVVQG